MDENKMRLVINKLFTRIGDIEENLNSYKLDKYELTNYIFDNGMWKEKINQRVSYLEDCYAQHRKSEVSYSIKKPEYCCDWFISKIGHDLYKDPRRPAKGLTDPQWFFKHTCIHYCPNCGAKL